MRTFYKLVPAVFFFTTCLFADPVRGMFASLNLGASVAFQNHDYTGQTGAVDKQKKTKIAPSFGVSLGLLNQIEKTKAVVGGEVSFTLPQSRQKYALNRSSGTADGNLTIKNPYILGVYGIAGLMLTPKLMLYGKAGYAWMKTELKYTDLRNENPNFQTYKKTMSGLGGGAGANYLLTNKIMLGAEYVYYAPKSITPRNNNSSQGGQLRRFVYHPSIHSLSMKLSMLF